MYRKIESHYLQSFVAEGKWKGIRVSQGIPYISHLFFFADDMVLFLEVTIGQIEVIKGYLDLFSSMSGQKVNYEKSTIFFSNGVEEDIATTISRETGIPRTEDLDKYLGVPSINGKMKKNLFFTNH